jgi:hypothetical protein
MLLVGGAKFLHHYRRILLIIATVLWRGKKETDGTMVQLAVIDRAARASTHRQQFPLLFCFRGSFAFIASRAGVAAAELETMDW